MVRGFVDDVWPELDSCVCPPQQDGPSVKLNTAAVLREGARVYQEQQQQEKRWTWEDFSPQEVTSCLSPHRLANLEAGEKDATEFTRWQEEMKQVHIQPCIRK